MLHLGAEIILATIWLYSRGSSLPAANDGNQHACIRNHLQVRMLQWIAWGLKRLRFCCVEWVWKGSLPPHSLKYWYLVVDDVFNLVPNSFMVGVGLSTKYVQPLPSCLREVSLQVTLRCKTPCRSAMIYYGRWPHPHLSRILLFIARTSHVNHLWSPFWLGPQSRRWILDFGSHVHQTKD